MRISELEIKLRKLDAEKLSLQSQVNKLNRLSNELKQQVSLSNRTSDDKSSKQEEKSSTYGEECKEKPLVIVAGDSLLQDIKGWLMSRSKQVKINSFRGATTSDMFDFLKPLLKKDPDHVILNIGTNDLQDTGLTPRDIVHDIVRLAKYITGQGINCSISGIIFRDDDLWMKGQVVNKILSTTRSISVRIGQFLSERSRTQLVHVISTLVLSEQRQILFHRIFNEGYQCHSDSVQIVLTLF